MRAVIFDLWNTLVDWAVEESNTLREDLAASTGLDEERFTALWQETYRLRETGPLERAFRALGVPDAEIEGHIAARHALTRRALVPRDGVLPTLEELRRRGLRLGLVSACTEEVPAPGGAARGVRARPRVPAHARRGRGHGRVPP